MHQICSLIFLRVGLNNKTEVCRWKYATSECSHKL